MVIFFAILLFSLLIFVHELGHFIVAKLSGVQVNEFSLFMGPAIFQKQVGGTLYSLRLIPIGGYCAMEGEDGDSDNPHAFGKAKWWKRLAILVAGSFMNFVAGLLMIFIVLAPAERFVTTQVADISPQSALAEGNAVLPGDRLLEIGGERLYTQGDFSLLLAVQEGDTHDVLVERGGKKVLLEDVKFQPRQIPEADGTTQLRYGITFDTAEATLGEKLRYTWYTGLDYARTVRLSLGMLLSGQAGIQDMSGPVGIVDQMSTATEGAESAAQVLDRLLSFGALIAVNLAVMNLLPLPALDGGRSLCLLLTAAVEGITRKKLNPKYEAYLHGAGMLVLLAFMAFITLKDILGLFR